MHRIGRDEPAAVVAGAGTSLAIAGYPELAASIEDLRVALGADTFAGLAARGQAMETNTMFRYALELVEDARDAV